MTSVIIRRQASGAMSRLASAIVPIASWIIGMSVSSMSLRTTPASLARWRTWAASGAISERAASARSAPREPPRTSSFSPRSWLWSSCARVRKLTRPSHGSG